MSAGPEEAADSDVCEVGEGEVNLALSLLLQITQTDCFYCVTVNFSSG